MNERTFTLALGSLTHSPLYYVIFVAAVLLGVLSFKAKSWRNKCREKGVVEESAIADKRLLGVRTLFALSVTLFVFATMDFGSARLMALKANCLQKVRQIAISQTIYASDNDDKIVASPNWAEPLSFYLGGSPSIVMHCRMAKGSQSYAVNRNLGGLKMSTIESLSDTVLVFESNTVSVGSKSDVAFDRHLERANFGFADGHADWASPQKSQGLTWIPRLRTETSP